MDRDHLWPAAVPALLVAVGMLVTARAASGATCVWLGSGADNNWSTAANWDCGHAPQNGDSVFFLDGRAKPVSHNNLSNLSLGALRISGAANSSTVANLPGDHWAIDGNGIKLLGPLNVQAAPDRTGLGPVVSLPIQLGAAVTMTTSLLVRQPTISPFALPAVTDLFAPPLPRADAISIGNLNLAGFSFTFN